jgi:hypothetical protein
MKKPEKRLDEALRAALAKYPRNLELARGMLRQAVESDLEVTWLILEPYWMTATEKLLRDKAAAIRGDRNEPKPEPWYKGERDRLEPKAKAKTYSKRSGPRVESLLRILIVPFLNRPFGDCTKEDLLAVERRGGAWARFAAYFAQPVPPQHLMADHWKHDDVAAWLAENAPELDPRRGMAA